MEDDTPKTNLPVGATEASYIRYAIAQRIAALAPVSFGQESVLTGSASRGVADAVSDIEMMFYGDALPPYVERERWFRSIDARDVVLDREAPGDQEVWATLYVDNIYVEAGWRVITAHEHDVENIVAGNVTEHMSLMLAWILQHAVSLRTQGALTRWQEMLTHYPEILPQKIIDQANGWWAQPQGFAIRWALLSRKEPMALAERLLADIRLLLRILFAINHQWEPDWKWLRAETERLQVKPERLIERISDIFSMQQNEQTIARYLLLIRDTLKLVPALYDVTRALANVEESLGIHGFSY